MKRRAGGLFIAAVALRAAAAAGQQHEERLVERAHQDRDIVYFLQQPETHSFDLYHDYTESEAGVDKYVNVVRKGSRASKPSARILDTGQTLEAQTLRGEEIRREKIDIGEPVEPSSEAVVIRFPAVEKGKSLRLRISETYTDEKSYRVVGDELVFDRSFGRSRNAVVLPSGWFLTACAIPAAVSQMPDGRIRLDFVNPRPDEIAVLIKAKKRR
jgi:hypothetical protein